MFPSFLSFPSVRSILLASAVAVACGCAAKAEPSSETASDLAVTAPRDVAGTYTWPTPEGWTTDTIPFPLSYAPELAYAGIEELRFAPDFFTPTAETYWSYSFAFILEGVPELSAEELSRDLTFYYAGLARAVDPKHFDASAHQARIAANGPHHYRGVLETVDAFGDGRALRLNLDGETSACGSRRIIIASLSQHPFDHAPVWNALDEQRRTFACAGK
jgi:hypothetical protein